MLSGATPSALAIAGTAVFRIVVSSDSMKNATATSHGSSRLGESPPGAGRALGASRDHCVDRLLFNARTVA